MPYPSHEVLQFSVSSFPGVSTNQTIAVPDLSPFSSVTVIIALTAITAGSVTLSLQQQDFNSSTWANIVSTASLTATGTVAISAGLGTNNALGSTCRLLATVVTGPLSFSITGYGKT